MEKRKPCRKQLDLFSNNPSRMQWEKLPQTDRQKVQLLLAQFLLSLLFDQIEIREGHHIE